MVDRTLSSVRLIDFNFIPLVKFLGTVEASVSYTEGQPPSYLSVGINITDVDDLIMAG